MDRETASWRSPRARRRCRGNAWARAQWVAVVVARCRGGGCRAVGAAHWSFSCCGLPDRARLPALRFEIPTAPTDDPSVALSADGTQIAFVANQNRVPVLWVRALDAHREPRAARHRGRQLSVLVAGRPHARVLRRRQAEADRRRRRHAAGDRRRAERPRRHVECRRRRSCSRRASAARSCACRRAAVPRSRDAGECAAADPIIACRSSCPTANDSCSRRRSAPRRRTACTWARSTRRRRCAFVPDDTGGRFAAPDTLLAIRQGALQAYRFDADVRRRAGRTVVIAQGFAARVELGVCDLGYRRAGVPRRHRAAPAAGVGQPAGRRAARDWRAETDFVGVAGAEPGRAVGASCFVSAPATTTSG